MQDEGEWQQARTLVHKLVAISKKDVINLITLVPLVR